MAWLTATVFFIATYASPCRQLPPPEQLQYFEVGGDDADFLAGVGGPDVRGLKHFPRLWCAPALSEEGHDIFPDRTKETYRIQPDCSIILCGVAQEGVRQAWVLKTLPWVTL